jgi:hypothetical protein
MTTLERTRRIVFRARKRTLVAARPSWASGAARLVDLGGVFDRYALQTSPAKTVAEALASDWAMVGEDLHNAIEAHVPLPPEK